MTKYSARKTAPSYTNRYFIHTSAGGLNSCILIDNGSCLPNCVGYAWGRVYEYLGSKPKLARTNAENWYGYTADGYKRSQVPEVGDVICWRKGKAGYTPDGAGHVAVVEQVNTDGSIVTSNSDFGGRRFYLMNLKKPYSISGLIFQGFIHIKDFEDEEPVKLQFKVGDKVIINGSLYVSSNADSPTGTVKNKITTITRVAEGTKHPYNTTGDLGWMNEVDIKSYKETALKVGDKVKIISSGNSQANGKGYVAGGIGWQRKILKIYDGYAYPYQVGNEYGTTGFFKASDLKKV